MSGIVKTKYPLDRTGQAASNRVENEPRTVEREVNRALAPYGGPFYPESMHVFDAATGKELKVNTDFVTSYPYPEAEDAVARPVHTLVEIRNKDYDQVKLTYQVVGEPFGSPFSVIAKIVTDLQQDNRPVHWDNVFGKPVTFMPAPHTHNASDTYGYEYLILGLEEISRNILQGDVASHEIIYDYILRLRDYVDKKFAEQEDKNKDIYKQIERLDSRIDDVLAQLQALRNDYNAHKADRNNPHGVTKAQVLLGSVENLPLATQQQAEAGLINTAYMTPVRVSQYVVKYVTEGVQSALNTHVADRNNPHGVTKAQVQLGLVNNFGTATPAETIAGTAGNLYTTPAGVKAALDSRLQSYIPNSYMPNTGAGWNGIVNKLAFIQSNGVLELGKYQDWHNDGSPADYDLREYLNWGVMGTWEIYNTGCYNAIDVYIRSDLRDKSDVRRIAPHFADKVLRNIKNGITYRMKNQELRSAGLAAQSVYKEFPEGVVSTFDPEVNEHRYSLRNGATIGLLVSGYNYQSEELRTLRKELAGLKRRLNSMSGMLRQLTKA